MLINTNSIKTNKDLSDAVVEAIKATGIKKAFIAEKLGIKREVFSRMLYKKNFSLDDANRILNLIGLETETILIKKSEL